MISRRQLLLNSLGAIGAAGGLPASYAFAIEPGWRLRSVHYDLQLDGWSPDSQMRIVALADIHAGGTYMPPRRIDEIVATANKLAPDLTVILGDIVTTGGVADMPFEPHNWAPMLGRLAAPLGVHAVLGNHDWLDDAAALERCAGPVRTRVALEEHGIHVLENDALRLEARGQAFWLLGLADQIAFKEACVHEKAGRRGPADLASTLAQVTDQQPAILLAHEPDIFPSVPGRVGLTLSGHTHGGQVRVGGWSPVVPSDYGNRYAYGHVVEAGKSLIVSGGLGTSGLPVRLGVPPEIVVIDVAGAGRG